MGLCCSTKNVGPRKLEPFKVIITPPTPEEQRRHIPKKDRPKENKKEVNNNFKMSEIDKDHSSALDAHLERLRMAEPTSSEVARRRMSHAGFDAHREVELARRGSLPAHLMFPKDEDRKLHKSSACFDFVKDQHEIKVVLKSKKAKALDERLQNFLRRHQAMDTEEDNEFEDNADEIKRGASDTNLKDENDIKVGHVGEVRQITSDSDITGAEFVAPEE